MEIEKQTNSDRDGNFRGITQESAFKLETECLKLIKQNYKCICGLDYYHFPKLISCNRADYKFNMTNCGETLDTASNLIEIKKQELQVKCIVDNLRRSKIQHLDMTRTGRNICITPAG